MTQPSSIQTSDSFEKLYSYSFHTDPEFANGLAIILGHPDTPATQEEMKKEDDLVLRAKCFFFSRKENINPPIDYAAYKSYALSRSTGEQIDTSVTSQGPSESEPLSGADVTGDETSTPLEPAYPSSFAHIVELITTGQPIPGIEQIPDTVLTGHDTASEKPRRRKPWERDATESSSGEPVNEAV